MVLFITTVKLLGTAIAHYQTRAFFIVVNYGFLEASFIKSTGIFQSKGSPIWHCHSVCIRGVCIISRYPLLHLQVQELFDMT